MDEHGAIQEMDEDYEDSSIEDEDELNHRIQDKPAYLPNAGDPENLVRSQTEPHGDLSQYEHKYKHNKDKHVSKKKKNGKSSSKNSKTTNNNKQSTKLNSSSPPKQSKLSKSQSMHSSHSKQSYKRDDIEDVDVESVEGDDEYQHDILNQTINEEEQYLDMSITAEDMSNGLPLDKKPSKRGTLDFVKSGFKSVQNRLLSPDKLSAQNGNNGHMYSGKDSPVSTSISGNRIHTPSSPDDNIQLTHSLSQHSNSDHYDGQRKDSTPSHSKKGSVSSGLFGGGSGSLLSKGKGLFGRSGSSKDFSKNSDDEKVAAQQHKKSESKTNLSSWRGKLQGLTKSYSSKNVNGNGVNNKTPPSDSNQNVEPPKVTRKKKSSSKKKEDKDKNDSKTSSNKASKSNGTKSDAKQLRKRSASSNKSSAAPPSHKNKSVSNGNAKSIKNSKSTIKAPPKRELRVKPKDEALLKRKSEQIPRSRSMKPSKSSANIADRRGHRHTTKEVDKLPLKRSASKGKVSRKSAGNLSDHKGLTMQKAQSEMPIYDRNEKKEERSTSKKAKNTLGVDEDKSNKKRRSKSGGNDHDDDKKKAKERKEKELEKSMLAADKKCKYRIKNEIFELYEYYKPIRLIGSGAYAVVCEAIDERTKKRVAIKKNKHIFDDIRDARRILREIKLLLHFNKYKHPDLIEIYDSLPPSVSEIQDFEDVYIVMPLLESNLCKIITSKQKLSNLHYQYLTYQVLRGLKFIHEAGVIHRDIKPENILLNGSDCDVKIIDFGLARGVLGQEGEDNPENAKATEYVCTRWYRSPEVMCSGGRYDEKMDIWGVGCILAEMILRRPLFPGANYLDQLQQIFDIMGTPKHTDWILNDQARSWVQKLPKHNGKNLKKMIAHKFEDSNNGELDHCTDLLYKLLELNPADRISAADSLSHPYFKEMHDEEEVLSGEKFDLSFEFEQSIKTKFGVRHMMYSALNEYHKKQWHRIRKKQKRREQKEREKAEKAANGKSTKSSKHKHRSSKHASSSKHKHKSSKHKTKE